MLHFRKMETCGNMVVPRVSIQHSGLSLGCWFLPGNCHVLFLKLVMLKDYALRNHTAIVLTQWYCAGNFLNFSVPISLSAWLL